MRCGRKVNKQYQTNRKDNTMSLLRFNVVKEGFCKKAEPVDVPGKRPSRYFAQQVFNREKMLAYLTKEAFDALTSAIDNKKPLSRETADAVAKGMKHWAMDMGATHYTHWLHPLTDGTAEKHDSFIEHDGKGGVIEQFSGKLLIQQEVDASSFPNGGIRNTFEARGYSAWDVSSPAFIMGRTLCIPTIFISYTGESLDYKTPLLRALNTVDKAATDVCRMFDPNVKRVYSYLGWEQEYFLVDESLVSARPDIIMTGRTLMGHESAKNQQLEDHYFGSIPSRVEAFMQDLEIECHKLGIPAKTRHNEVAPNQFEIAPVYEETNISNDHNLLLMSVMREVAKRHGFCALLHEKPFAGVNGSGKHCNWSLGTDTGVPLFTPGKDDMQNLQFITFIVNVISAVRKHNGLLKASISSAGNAHRLGANEAPPAIISIFMGKQMSGILNTIATTDSDGLPDIDGKSRISLNLPQTTELTIDSTDRNRTSPFAFTGNRFEFRAVGSSANCASAMIALNAAVADELLHFKAETEKLIAKGEDKVHAIVSVLGEMARKCIDIVFDGNGYSEEWKKEAEQRGLDCQTSTPLIFDNYLSKASIEMFKNTNVLSELELKARNEVKWEMYTKKLQIEARVLGDLALNHIVPVAMRYQTMIADNAIKIKQLFTDEKAGELTAHNIDEIEKIAGHITAIREQVEQIVEARKVANRITNERDKAIAYHDTVAPLLDTIRRHIDKLELMVDNRMWPMPKYRELLFIN